MKIFDKILYRFFSSNHEYFVVLSSALGISPLGANAWTTPYMNYFNSNPLHDSWAVCKRLCYWGLMQQGETVKTAFKVTELGLGYLGYLADKWEDENLKLQLEKVLL